MKRNSQAFTHAVHVLFQTLRAWDADGPAKESRSLFLDISDIHSPMDGRHRGFDKYQEDAELYGSGKRDDLWHHRYEHSMLQLLEHPALPSLLRVSSLALIIIVKHSLKPSFLPRPGGTSDWVVNRCIGFSMAFS